MSAEILTVERAAELLGCAPSTIEERLLSRELPGVKIGRSWCIPAQALYEVLNEMARQHVARKARHMPVTVAKGKLKRTPPTLPAL